MHLRQDDLIDFDSLSKTATYKRSLSSYITETGIDAQKLEAAWFGQTPCDVFISHARSDADLAGRLSAFLADRFDLRSFIDSSVWGHSDDLLKALDNTYCLNKGTPTTYDYDLRNRSTSHVYMMLAAALFRMIDQTECCIFLNTPSSISSHGTVMGGNETTASPWIYMELTATQLVRLRVPSRFEANKRTAVLREALGKAFPTIHHPVQLSHFAKIDSRHLDAWEATEPSAQGPSALDKLYELSPGDSNE